MARRLRVQYPGAIYHVMNRGDHSECIFRDGHDPELFITTLAEACPKTDFQVHSFCLGAVISFTSSRRLLARSGCEQTACWASGVLPWTVPPAEQNGVGPA